MQAAGGTMTGQIMVLALDVGNTHSVFGLFANGKLAGRCSLTTHRRLTSDEALMRAREALATLLVGQSDVAGTASLISDISTFTISGSILSCVVPALTDTWTTALASLASTRPLVVGPGLRTGLCMRYKDPAEIGSDRIADVVAARQIYGAPVVVVDLGTTTNIEVIDREGTFLGGLIAPGLRLGASVLSEAAARLPMIDLHAPRHVIGQTTREAMQSGVVFGEIARIDGLLDAVLDELGCEAPVVLTGDDASTMALLLKHEVLVDADLTLQGLWQLWERNHH